MVGLQGGRAQERRSACESLGELGQPGLGGGGVTKQAGKRAYFLVLSALESQSRPSYRPSPVVAQQGWT